jgi:metallo-beta-lactamase superfamily protein
MRRAGVLLLVFVFIATACATTTPVQGPALVSRAVQAEGGADALSAVKTLGAKGTMRYWEPEQSLVPGGDMRYAAEATFDVVSDVGAGATRIDWVRKFEYPSPRTFTFTEIVTPEAGYVAGIDSNGRTKQSLEATPPAHSMSGLRLAASQRELRRGSPLFTLEMLQRPDRIVARAPVKVGDVKYLVLTHHHMDHAGGLRAFVAQGATLVVGPGTTAHYRRVLAARATRNPDLPPRDLGAVTIMEVADKRVFTDGREVAVYAIDNPHANGMLIGYVVDARLGFVTDVWTPGPPLPDKLNPNLASVVAAVKKQGISPSRFAGGHGSIADYAPLAALEGK